MLQYAILTGVALSGVVGGMLGVILGYGLIGFLTGYVVLGVPAMVLFLVVMGLIRQR